jgi:hypothetical protein
MISTYFREMPAKEDATNTAGCDATIHVDADSTPFKHLLDLVTGATVLAGDNYITFQDVQEILEVGDQFGFTNLPRLLLPIMHEFANEQAWEVFNFAAQNDFMTLAIYAIDRFPMDPFIRDVGIFNVNADVFDDIPGKYTVPLIRNMTWYRTITGAAQWRKIASNFPTIRNQAT